MPPTTPATLPDQHIHANLVCIDRTGVLLRGAAGVGKSLLTLQLLDRGHALIADDLVHLFPESGQLHGRASGDNRQLHLRGHGLIDIDRRWVLQEHATIGLLIDLQEHGPSGENASILAPELDTVSLCGVDIHRARLGGAAWQWPLRAELLVNHYQSLQAATPPPRQGP